MINGPYEIFFERDGEIFRNDSSFSSEITYSRFLKNVLLKIEKVADRRHPLVDGTFSDGTRVHVALPPVTPVPIVTVRRHVFSHWDLGKLILKDFIKPLWAEKLAGHVEKKSNILICGPTGCGKTTFLRALLLCAGPHERIVTIEDADEIKLKKENSVSLVTRECPEGLVPTISLRDLLKNSLRMKPDRIVVGEIRGDEALIFLDALATGHSGSISSIHANSGFHALARLESLASRAAPQWPVTAIRQLVFESVDLVVTVEKKEKCRRVSEISELSGIENFGYLLDHW